MPHIRKQYMYLLCNQSDTEFHLRRVILSKNIIILYILVQKKVTGQDRTGHNDSNSIYHINIHHPCSLGSELSCIGYQTPTFVKVPMRISMSLGSTPVYSHTPLPVHPRAPIEWASSTYMYALFFLQILQRTTCIEFVSHQILTALSPYSSSGWNATSLSNHLSYTHSPNDRSSYLTISFKLHMLPSIL